MEKASRNKQIVVTIRYCDESELTVEERARMESARVRLNRQVRDLIGKLVMEQAERRGALRRTKWKS